VIHAMTRHTKGKIAGVPPIATELGRYATALCSSIWRLFAKRDHAATQWMLMSPKLRSNESDTNTRQCGAIRERAGKSLFA
jgi:hypothetical protein